MRRLAAGIGLAACSLVLGSTRAATAAPDEERVLDRRLLDDGSTLTVRVMQGTHLAVRVEGGKGLSLQAHPIADLLGPGEVVEARAAPRARGDVLVAIVLRTGAEHAYRWLTTSGGKDGGWRVGKIMSSPGDPYRVVEVRDPGGDGVEVTLRRGALGGRPGGAPVEERVYSYDGAADASVLLTMRPGESEGTHTGGPIDGTEVAPRPRRNPEPAPPPPTPASLLARLKLTRTGTVSFDPPGDAAQEPEWTGRLDAPALAAKSLKELEDAMAAAADRPGRREADGSSSMRLVVTAEPEARWRWLQWVLATAASPRVKIHRLRFGDGPDAVDHDLPRDRGADGQAPAPHVGVKLLRSEGPPPTTTVRSGNPIFGGDVALAPGAGRAAALETLVERLRLRLLPGVAGVRIDVDGASGDEVPYADVLDVIRAARAAGAQEVHFQGAAPPR